MNRLIPTGFRAAETILVQFPVDPDIVERELGFPVVVKTLVGSQGSGAYLAEDREKLMDLLQFVEVNSAPGFEGLEEACAPLSRPLFFSISM